MAQTKNVLKKNKKGERITTKNYNKTINISRHATLIEAIFIAYYLEKGRAKQKRRKNESCASTFQDIPTEV